MDKLSINNIVVSKSCIDNVYNCNEFKYNIDDILDHKGDYHTQKKMEDHLTNTKNCELTDCCDKSKDNYYLLTDAMKKKYYKINIESNKIVSFSQYNSLSDEDKIKYSCPTSYEICKYGTKNELRECPHPMCTSVNGYMHPFKQYKIDHGLIELQYKLLESIKADDVLLLEKIIPSSYKINQPLLITYPGNTLLFDSIMYEANNCTLFILKENIDLSIQNKNGNTALTIACLKGNNIIVNQLLLMGSDITLRNNAGEDALLCAIRSGNYECVMQMLNNGASIHILNKRNENPLFISVITPIKNLSIINMLVEMGCNILDKNIDLESMLKILNKDHKNTDIGRQISTLLINTVIKLKGQHYYKVINDMPEFSILEYEHTPVLLNEGDITVTVPNAYTVPPSETYNPARLTYSKRRKEGINMDTLKNNSKAKPNTDINTNTDITEHFATTSLDSKKDYTIMEFSIGIFIILMGIAFTFYLIRN